VLDVRSIQAECEKDVKMANMERKIQMLELENDELRYQLNFMAQVKLDE